MPAATSGDYTKSVAVVYEPRLDTAVMSTWVDLWTFQKWGGWSFEDAKKGVALVDGKLLDVVRTGRLTFPLWERFHKDGNVRVMRARPSRLLIGQEFMIRHKMNLNFGSGLRSYSVHTPTRAVCFSSRILDDRTQVSDKQVAAVH